MWLMRRRVLGRAPAGWWNKPVPKAEKVCYRRKSDALRVFLDHNYRIVEQHGGPNRKESPAEFDAVNHKYGTKARSIAEAVWAALPTKRRPFCLTDIDLVALNATDPGQNAERAGIQGFVLPEFVYDPARKIPKKVKLPAEPPQGWEARCRRWGRAHKIHKRERTDQCFTDRYGNDKCVCRHKGKFVSCGYVPGVPF